MTDAFNELPDDIKTLRIMVATRNELMGELHVRLRLAQAEIKRLETQIWYLKNPTRYEN